MNYQFFNVLPIEAKMIREQVFIKEQGFQNEFDDIDARSWHLLHELEKKARELGYLEAMLSAQVNAKAFYEKNGYVAYGEEYLDEFCPHIHMKKIL